MRSSSLLGGMVGRWLLALRPSLEGLPHWRLPGVSELQLQNYSGLGCPWLCHNHGPICFAHVFLGMSKSGRKFAFTQGIFFPVACCGSFFCFFKEPFFLQVSHRVPSVVAADVCFP